MADEDRGLMPDVPEDRAEVRSVQFTDVDVSEDGLKFTGYAAVFDKIADLGDFTEEVRRGAFRKVLSQSANVPMYWDHDERMPPLATTRGGTLRLSEDAKGLRVEADLDNDHYMTPTLRSMIRRGDVSGMSFGFVAGRGNSQIEERAGRPHRILTNFKMLLDVSPTWNPQYEGTSSEMRSALAEIRKARIDHGQQVVSGEYQQADDGAPGDGTDDAQEVVEDTTQDTTDEVVEERDSGVDSAQAELAARRRRLQLMGLTLSSDDMSWIANGDPEARNEKPPRDLEEVLLYRAETWSADEYRRVLERRKAVQSELFELVGEAERAGRNLTDEELETYKSLQDEFQRLTA